MLLETSRNTSLQVESAAENNGAVDDHSTSSSDNNHPLAPIVNNSKNLSDAVLASSQQCRHAAEASTAVVSSFFASSRTSGCSSSPMPNIQIRVEDDEKSEPPIANSTPNTMATETNFAQHQAAIQALQVIQAIRDHYDDDEKLLQRKHNPQLQQSSLPSVSCSESVKCCSDSVPHQIVSSSSTSAPPTEGSSTTTLQFSAKTGTRGEEDESGLERDDDYAIAVATMMGTSIPSTAKSNNNGTGESPSPKATPLRTPLISTGLPVAGSDVYKSGIQGVRWNRQYHRWGAIWREEGRQRHKYFSALKYGFNQAKMLAIAYRKKMESRFGGVSRSVVAAKYDNHNIADGNTQLLQHHLSYNSNSFSNNNTPQQQHLLNSSGMSSSSAPPSLVAVDQQQRSSISNNKHVVTQPVTVITTPSLFPSTPPAGVGREDASSSSAVVPAVIRDRYYKISDLAEAFMTTPVATTSATIPAVIVKSQHPNHHRYPNYAVDGSNIVVSGTNAAITITNHDLQQHYSSSFPSRGGCEVRAVGTACAAAPTTTIPGGNSTLLSSNYPTANNNPNSSTSALHHYNVVATARNNVTGISNSNNNHLPDDPSLYRSGVPGVLWCSSNKVWKAKWSENGRKFCKGFSVSKNGFEKARELAVSYRRRMETTGRATLANRKMTSGIKGVVYQPDRHCWCASWNLRGQRGSKEFPTSFHGFEEARTAAIAYQRALQAAVGSDDITGMSISIGGNNNGVSRGGGASGASSCGNVYGDSPVSSTAVVPRAGKNIFQPTKKRSISSSTISSSGCTPPSKRSRGAAAATTTTTAPAGSKNIAVEDNIGVTTVTLDEQLALFFVSLGALPRAAISL
eukprot:TRINITY_DN670_c0_g1_i1.p1 TRINITY_DN670_c0_g1~~TRINITY_DN670_c0_g1_i1.p1  ORF type:complete len:852 (+),score=116.49 TRINITY_DN670_c0_g1_i1:169-2724(+)